MEFIKPKKYIKQNKFVPSKKMGQNFLVDQNILDLIKESIDEKSFDAIIEIGPGLGALTKKLLEFKKPLYLIELDKRLYSYLYERLGKENNIKIYNEDVLRFNLNEISDKYKKCIIIANLPYSISTLAIIKFLKINNIKNMYCMLQKEVVKRLSSTPSHHEYNAFACIFQHQATCVNLLDVAASCFEPIPKVDSNFVLLTKKPNITFDVKYDKFLKQAFLAKRKTLHNNLKHIYTEEQIKDVFKKFKLDSMIRIEAIDEKTIHKIYMYLTN
ncbi:MAG: ribosomal RNA small subunit methyltransferase A [Malacoplasma sp.]|nr:ribosomal RNA small subunit methyltransferase A [Malacoplasma sp.]